MSNILLSVETGRNWEQYADAKGMSHILLRCPATRQFKGEFIRKKWMYTNEDVVYENILNKQPPHLEPSLKIGGAMPSLHLLSVPSWHVIGRTLNCTCTNKTFVMVVV